MPHLVYSGRYWRFAGDEIFVPGVLATFWRTVWTSIMIIVLLTTVKRLSACPGGWLMISYLALSILSFIMAIVCEVLLINVSLKGTIIERDARSDLGYYLSAHAWLGLAQFLLTVFGFFVLSARYQLPCASQFQDNVDLAMLFFVVISQLVDVLSLLCCCYLFSAQSIEEAASPVEGEESDGESDEDEMDAGAGAGAGEGCGDDDDALTAEEGGAAGADVGRISRGASSASTRSSGGGGGAGGAGLRRLGTRQRMSSRASSAGRLSRANTNVSMSSEIGVWESRCRALCRGLQLMSCNLLGGSGLGQLSAAEDFEAVAKVLTHFFQHDGFLDVVPSDVAAGILLVRAQQRFEDDADGEQLRDLGPQATGAGTGSAASAAASLDPAEADNICVRSAVMVGSKISSSISNSIAVATSAGSKKSDDAGSSVPPPAAESSSGASTAVGGAVSSTGGTSVYSRRAASGGPSPSPTTVFADGSLGPSATSVTAAKASASPSIMCETPDQTEFDLSTVSHFKRDRILNRHVYSRRSERDRAAIAEAYHFSVYALALYSQLITLYMFPLTGACRLCGVCGCVGGACCTAGEGPPAAAAAAAAASAASDPSRMPLTASPVAERDIEAGGEEGASDEGLAAESSGDDAASGSGTSSGAAPAVPGGSRVSMAGVTVGDNKCGSHRAAVKEILRVYGMEQCTDIYYLSLVNTTFAKPYAVLVDHSTHSVVVSIRGTLSLEDCITDAMAEPVEMTTVGRKWGFQGAKKFAHGGMLRAADHIRTELESKGILMDIFGVGGGVATAAVGVADRKAGKASANARTPLVDGMTAAAEACRSYQLVVTGHSLGAACAVLLAMLLRPAFPAVRCITYGTPGSVVDAATSEELRSYVTSVCLGSDIVCRLSVKSLSRLREDVLDCISRSKVNKYVITKTLWVAPTDPAAQPSALMHARGTEPMSSFKESAMAYKAHISKQLSREVAKVELRIPGNIIHLSRTHSVGKRPGSLSNLGGSTSTLQSSPTATDASGNYPFPPSSSSPRPTSSGSDTNSNTAAPAPRRHLDNSGGGQIRCCRPCSCCLPSKAPGFTPVAATQGDMDTIYVSPTMVWDHLPDRYVNELASMHHKMSRGYGHSNGYGNGSGSSLGGQCGRASPGGFYGTNAGGVGSSGSGSGVGEGIRMQGRSTAGAPRSKGQGPRRTYHASSGSSSGDDLLSNAV